jgi:hypothetical protein
VYFSAVAVKRVAKRTTREKKTAKGNNTAKEKAIACLVF